MGETVPASSEQRGRWNGSRNGARRGLSVRVDVSSRMTDMPPLISLKRCSLLVSTGARGFLAVVVAVGVAGTAESAGGDVRSLPDRSLFAAAGEAGWTRPAPDSTVGTAPRGSRSLRTGAANKPTRRHSLGIAHARRGWALIRQGAYAAAERAFARADELVPDEPMVLVGLGFSYKLVAKYDRAVATLERAIHLDASVGRAYGLLGDLYARRGELERAIHHYRIARKLDPGDVTLRDRMQLARMEYRAELEFDRLYSAHFLVKYRASTTDSRLVHEVVDRLEQAYEQLGQALLYFPRETFSVILYPDGEFWETTDSPWWARGLFDGTIHLPLQEVVRHNGFRDGLLRHEYTHAVVDHLTAGRAPVWLSEGLALYFEGPRESREVFVPGPDGSRPDRSQIGTPETRHGDFLALPLTAAREAYAHSYSATLSLIRRYNLRRVRALLQALSETSDFPRAFEAVFHSPFRTFRAQWLVQPRGRRF